MHISLRHIFGTSFALAVLTACGGGSTGGAAFSANEKKFVKNLFLTEYLWAERVDKSISPDVFNTPQSLVTALRVNPPDKWSFSMSAEAYQNYSQQKTTGFGIGYQNDFRIFVVLIDSPAYQKLQRGDIIQKIDGEAVSVAGIRAASSALNTPVLFTVTRDGQSLDISVTPREYTHKVTYDKVIQHAGKKVGYLRYDAFTSSSVSELHNVFEKLRREAIDELVIDLRYNGGGSILTAKKLLEHITLAHPGEKQVYLDWNSANRSRNSNYYFEEATEQDGDELDMQRVFFLTTARSASASELVINALKPYLGESDVITIGEQTHGKPVGMSGRLYGERNYYFLINFIVRNNEDEAVPFTGIPPTCSANDDTTHTLGDPSESMLLTALYYIEHGSCPEGKGKYTKIKEKSSLLLEPLPIGIQGLWTTPSPSHD